jgi:hypothetical protein
MSSLHACIFTPNASHCKRARVWRLCLAGVESWCIDSDEFVKANATSLSPECGDLLDKIFIADEFKRTRCRWRSTLLGLAVVFSRLIC